MPNDVNDGLTEILDDLFFFVVVRRKVTIDDVKGSFKTNVVSIKKATEFLIKSGFIRQEDDYLYPSHHLDLLLADFLSNKSEQSFARVERRYPNNRSILPLMFK